MTEIDQSAIDNLLTSVGGDTAFVSDLIGEYFTDTRIQFGNMQQALDAGDVDSFRRAAHSLKSNSANFGATQLAALCRHLEDLAKANNLSDASDILHEAQAEYEQVEIALKAYRG